MEPITCDLCFTTAKPKLQLITELKRDTGNIDITYNTFRVYCSCRKCNVIYQTIEATTKVLAIINTTPLDPDQALWRVD